MILSAFSLEWLQFTATLSGYNMLVLYIRAYVPLPDSAALLVHVFSCLLFYVLCSSMFCVLVPEVTFLHKSSGPYVCFPSKNNFILDPSNCLA